MLKIKIAATAIAFFIVSSAAFLITAALHGAIHFFFTLGIIGFMWGMICLALFAEGSLQAEFDTTMREDK